jgi:hypothetical protein
LAYGKPTGQNCPADGLVAKAGKKGPKPFFGLPDFSCVRLGDDRPGRLDVGALGGRRTLVINGFDPDRFSGSVVYAETSTERMEALDPQAPLRGLERNETTERLFREHWRPTLDLRAAPDCQTNLPPKSMAAVVVYEAQRIDPAKLAAEIMRVAMPGAKVIVMGIGPVYVEPAFDTEFNQLLKVLSSFWTSGERSVWSGFRDLPLKLDERSSLVTKPRVRNQYATAKWTFSQLERFLRSYPVIERVQQPGVRGGGDSGDMPTIDLKGMFARLKQAWGTPTKTRPIYWPVFMLTGFVPEPATAGVALEGDASKVAADADGAQ